jgi:hypothetical protein
MRKIIVSELELLEIAKMNEGVFWCRFGRIDGLRARSEDALELERSIKSRIHTGQVGLLKCALVSPDSFATRKPEWIKSVGLSLCADSESDVEEFLVQIGQ